MVLSGWQHLTDDDLARIADGITQGRVNGGPWHLEVHPTHRCNVGCFFCINENQRPSSSPLDLPWPRLEALLNELADRDLRMLRLSGGGEPLVYAEIRHLLDLMGRRGIRLVDLTTNGTRLKDLGRDILAIGADLVTVSLNECAPDRYAKSMRSHENGFWRVIQGIETLQTAPTDHARPQIRVQFFVHRDNWRELARMYEFGRELNADFIFIRTLLGRPASARIPAQYIPDLKTELAGIIEKDAAEGRGRLQLDLSHECELHHFTYAEQLRRGSPAALELPDFHRQDPRLEYCFMPWYAAVIGVDGDVCPCCLLMDTPLGNILTQSWDEIWDGPNYRRIRHEIRQLMLAGGDGGGSCFHCLQPQCLSNYGCQWTYHLCTPAFYENVSSAMPSSSVRNVLRASSEAHSRG